MICKKCNAQIEDSAAFCHMCGVKCTEEADSKMYATASVSGQNEQFGDVSVQNEEATQPFEQYPEFEQGAGYEPFATQNAPVSKKKGRAKTVFITILAIVLIIVAAGAVFGKTVFFAIAPETYVATIANNTVQTVAKEVDSIEKNVFGFDLSADKNLTLCADAVYNDGDEEYKFSGAVSNLPDKEKLLFEGSYEDDNGKGDLKGFWDNENIGVMTAGTDGKYLCVPSKDFGEEFEDSDGYLSQEIYRENETIYEILSELDLSYKTLYDNFTGKSKLAKRTEKHYTKNLIKLLEKGDIDSRDSVKYEFDDGKVNAKKITLTLETKDLYNFLIGSLTDIKNDKKLQDDINKDAFREYIKQLKEQKKDADDVEFDVEITEYNGKIVSLAFTVEEDEDDAWDEYSSNVTTTFRIKDKKNFLNSMEIETKSESTYKDDEDDYKNKTKYIDTFGIESNWVDEDNEINITLYDTYESTYKSDGDKYEYTGDSEIELTLDYDAQKWNLKIKNSNTDSDGEKTSDIDKYKGTCSKKGGFKFAIDEKWQEETYTNEMSYDEWLDTGYTDWLDEVYEENREDYLEYVYQEVGDFYYDYDTYTQWYRENGNIWDRPDSDFEEWLFDYAEIYDLYSAYDEATRKIENKDASLKVNISLKPKAELKFEKAGTKNIMNWQKDDFEDFEEDAEKEFKKKGKKK